MWTGVCLTTDLSRPPGMMMPRVCLLTPCSAAISRQGLRRSADQDNDLADTMFAEAEKEYTTGSAATDTYDERLGTAGYIWDRITGWFRGLSKEEALRRALLDWLKDDKTFNIDNKDDTCKDVVRSVGSGIHFIVTGHTHLERAIDLGGGRYYFNCGTWIRLLRFTEKILADEAAFKPVYDLLKDGSMTDIDNARFDGCPLRFKPQQRRVH